MCPDAFTCDNSNCIPSIGECDRIDNCGDNSDEDHCDGTFNAAFNIACEIKHLNCCNHRLLYDHQAHPQILIPLTNIMMYPNCWKFNNFDGD